MEEINIESEADPLEAQFQEEEEEEDEDANDLRQLNEEVIKKREDEEAGIRFTISRLQKEKEDLHNKCCRLEEENQLALNNLKQQYDVDTQRIKKEVELATKAKESIVMRYANSEKENLRQKKEMENVEKYSKVLLKEIEGLNKKMKTMINEKERLTSIIASLQAEINSSESFKSQLASKNDRIDEIQLECDSLKQTNEELLADMSLCRNKEEELVNYTKDAVEKNCVLQSELASAKSKSEALSEENEILRIENENLLKQVKNFESISNQEKKGYHKDLQAQNKSIENLKKEMAELQQRYDEANGEIALIKKRNNSTLKEMNRELVLARRQIKEMGGNASGDGMSSRTSSSSSLNNIESNIGPTKTKSMEIVTSQQPEKSEMEPPVIPDQQDLIERIVRLQKNLAKKHEKIEFLQEHGKQLVDALQKKTRIIQTYAMHQDDGALSSVLSDQNKAEVVKHGGIMASLYGSTLADDGMTLELSLEINKKLQAVLEDALLKNITLKENMNTLGKEISRLTAESYKRNEKEKNDPS